MTNSLKIFVSLLLLADFAVSANDEVSRIPRGPGQAGTNNYPSGHRNQAQPSQYDSTINYQNGNLQSRYQNERYRSWNQLPVPVTPRTNYSQRTLKAQAVATGQNEMSQSVDTRDNNESGYQLATSGRQHETDQFSILDSSRVNEPTTPIPGNSSADLPSEYPISLTLRAQNLTLIVMGRSGMGISSTVRTILGSHKTIETPTGNKTPITEYILPISNEAGKYFKVVDVDGLVDGKSIEQDAATLSALKSFLTDPLGLNSQPPNYFIVISNFDDARIQGEKSQFMEVLNRAATVQKAVYNTTSPNTLFMLTRFMSSTRSVQRKPKNNIKGFVDTIREFSDFGEPINIVVGENLAADHGLDVEDGFTKLPNGDRYPENIYKALINISNLANDTKAAENLNAILNDWANVGPVESKYYNPIARAENNGQITSELYGVSVNNDTTEIDSAMLGTFERLNNSAKARNYPGLLELQRHFALKNLTLLSQLPKSTPERVTFFQNFPAINSQKVGFIREAFNLSMPELILNPVVGYGFDVTQDNRVEISPFLSPQLTPSEIGYLIPDFLACSIIPPNSNNTHKDFASYTGTLENYVAQRYKLLGFEDSSAIPNMKFKGTVKFGFNLEPETPNSIVSLSALQEIRKFECRLNDVNRFTEEFEVTVRELTPFNPRDKHSVKAWRVFFNDYGTHVVSHSFIGGYVEGFIIGGSLRNIIDSPDKINQALEAILRFRNESLTERPNYRYFGGEKDSGLEYAAELDPKIRQTLLNDWENSLTFDPVALQYELELTPMHIFARRVNPDIGQEIERAADLLLHGKLEYSRPTRRPSSPKNSSVITTTPVPSSTYFWQASLVPTPSPTSDLPLTEPTPVITENPPTTTQTVHSNFNLPQSTTSKPDSIDSSESVPPEPDSLDTTGRDPHHSGENTEIRPQNPTILLPKHPQLDYAVRTLCQGYHMLKEVVLPTSPFHCNGKNWDWNRTIDACKLSRREEFESISEYVSDRLENTFKLASIPANPAQYYAKDQIVLGTIIRDKNDNITQDLIEVQTDFSYITTPNLTLTFEFRRDLASLPSFYYLDPEPDCAGKWRWKAFFEKYGTHYIKSFSSGFYYEANRVASRSNDNRVCKPCHPSYKNLPAVCNWVPFEALRSCEFHKPQIPFCEPEEILTFHGPVITSKVRKREINILKASFEFVSYADIFANSNYVLSSSLAEAMYQLVDNNLSCNSS